MTSEQAKLSPDEYDQDDYNKKFSDYFIPIAVLGSGSFGLCVSARDKNNDRIYAVKVIEKAKLNRTLRQQIFLEAELQSQLNHPNIARFHDVIETDTRILLSMELVRGGTLRKFILERQHSKNPITDEEAAIVMKGILLALNHIHSKGIVHRDLKLDNILIDDTTDCSTAKIIDFGLSAQYGEDEFIQVQNFTEYVGTKAYMAPEILNNKPYGKVNNPKSLTLACRHMERRITNVYDSFRRYTSTL